MRLFRRTPPSPPVTKPKAFRIELGWRGMFGLVVICFFLLLWMFLLGIWAGQTILLPPRPHQQGAPVEEPGKQPANPAGLDGNPGRQTQMAPKELTQQR